MFADDYPRFIETSGLKPKPNRMNYRYEALFAANRDIFEGARVLDLASHDGRWSFAALKTGAKHVTGVEVRESMVDNARETFAHYGQDPETYRFVCGDVFEVLAREKFDVDVVLLLGYLYHTYRHTELMYRIHELAPTHLILDTRVVRGKQPVVSTYLEKSPESVLNAAPDPYSVDRVLTGHHTLPALLMLLDAYGFEAESMHDWSSTLAGLPRGVSLADYAQGNRVTLRCRARGTDGAADGQRTPALAPISAPTPRAAARSRRRNPARARKRTPAGTGTGAATRARKGGANRARAVTRTQPPAQQTSRWRALVNRGLAKATGFELRRAAAPPGAR